ncbi:MAG: AAA family ATPase [Fibromonadaceae bacterium]|jgi:replicative DNA helicase|nr:AAA family ATPase [Fibromonadaceae bacterium]
MICDKENVVLTGFRNLDALTGGMRRKEMIVFAGNYPGIGKSTFTLNIAISLAYAGKSIVLFSGELKKNKISERLLCMRSGIDSKMFRDLSFMPSDINNMKNSANEFKNLNFLVHDDEIRIETVKSKCAEIKREKGLDLVIIDNLHSLKLGIEGNQTAAIEDICSKARAMAVELDVPALCTSKVTRKAYNNNPKLDHLRDSNRIGDYAAQVWFLIWKEKSEEAELRIIKNTGGKTGSVRFHFTGERFFFSEV